MSSAVETAGGLPAKVAAKIISYLGSRWDNFVCVVVVNTIGVLHALRPIVGAWLHICLQAVSTLGYAYTMCKHVCCLCLCLCG